MITVTYDHARHAQNTLLCGLKIGLAHTMHHHEPSASLLSIIVLERLRPVSQGALPHFGVLCEAFTSWRRFVDNGLHNEMGQVMQLYKQSLAAAGQWDAATGSLPQPIKEKLQQSFAV